MTNLQLVVAKNRKLQKLVTRYPEYENKVWMIDAYMDWNLVVKMSLTDLIKVVDALIRATQACY